jgi:hypothetical protein
VNDDEWERFGRKQLWPNLRHYASICMEGLREKPLKTTISTLLAGTSGI